MKIDNIDVSSYPNSEKIFVSGSIYHIKVAMRQVKQYPTVKIENGKRVEYPNAPVTIYDTSGPYTDPDFKHDVNVGLPDVRSSWILDRQDTVELDDITSIYGRQRRDDSKLDSIRFPKTKSPRVAKSGMRVSQRH